MDPLGQSQYRCKGRLQIDVVFDLATNMAHLPAMLRS